MLRILSSLLFCSYILTVQPTFSKLSKTPKTKKKESFIQFDDELECNKYCCEFCFCPPEIILSGTDVKTNNRIGFVLAEELRSKYYDTVYYKDYTNSELGFNEESQNKIESKFSIKPEYKGRTHKVLFTETTCRESDHTAYGSCEGIVEKHNAIIEVKEPITIFVFDKKNKKMEYLESDFNDDGMPLEDWRGFKGFSLEGYGKNIEITVIQNDDTIRYQKSNINLDGKLLIKISLPVIEQYGRWVLKIRNNQGEEIVYKIFRYDYAG